MLTANADKNSRLQISNTCTPLNATRPTASRARASTRLLETGYDFHFRSSAPVIFGYCEVVNGHFCCSLSLAGCRLVGFSATGSCQLARGPDPHQ